MVDWKLEYAFVLIPSFILLTPEITFELIFDLIFYFCFSVMACAAGQGNPDTATSIYDFKVNDIKGNEVILLIALGII